MLCCVAVQIATYLVAHQINHGIMLRKNPSLQYLYYLSQVDPP